MTTLERFGDMAQGVQGQVEDKVKDLSKMMKPYAKQVGRLSHDLRPYGKRALKLARKHPGKTAVGALLLGYLVVRLVRR